jgi:hypothetical protein
VSDPHGPGPATAGHLRVVAGGTPTPAELAALVVALTPAATAVPAPAEEPVPAWTRAALHEGVGGPRVFDPTELRHLAPRWSVSPGPGG